MNAVLPEMPCQEFVEHVTDYLEGALTAVDRERLEAHLARCADCAHYLEQLRVTQRLAGRITPGDVTPGMRDELIAAFARWRSGRLSVEHESSESVGDDPPPV